MKDALTILIYELEGRWRRDKFDEQRFDQQSESKEAIEIKQDWFKRTLEMFGCCGKLLYMGDTPVAYCQYAPPHLLPNSVDYSRELMKLIPDTILISCLYVRPEYQGKGLGRTLLMEVIQDLKNRGYKLIETYSRDDSPNNCSGPTAFYLKNAFSLGKTKK